MEKLNNMELDMLFRIDFFALANFDENEIVVETEYQKEIEKWKGKYSIKKYYQRCPGDHEYARLSELEGDSQAYCNYLFDLISISRFNCCQLEHAIGVFEKDELKAFLSNDSGACYNSNAHFSSVEEIIHNGESDLCDINTFYGKISGDSIELLYSYKSNNIDIKKTEGIVVLDIKKNEFETKLGHLKNRINAFFEKLKSVLQAEFINQDDKDFVEEVFQKIK